MSSDRWTEADYAAAVRRNGVRMLREAERTVADLIASRKPAKYGNQKVELDGCVFDSKKEAARYQELCLLAKAGLISGLELQPAYELHTVSPTGEKVGVGKLTLDFRYQQDGALVVEDVKSAPTKTQAYRLRKRIFEAEYGLRITEV